MGLTFFTLLTLFDIHCNNCHSNINLLIGFRQPKVTILGNDNEITFTVLLEKYLDGSNGSLIQSKIREVPPLVGLNSTEALISVSNSFVTQRKEL